MGCYSESLNDHVEGLRWIGSPALGARVVDAKQILVGSSTAPAMFGTEVVIAGLLTTDHMTCSKLTSLLSTWWRTGNGAGPLWRHQAWVSRLCGTSQPSCSPVWSWSCGLQSSGHLVSSIVALPVQLVRSRSLRPSCAHVGQFHERRKDRYRCYHPVRV